MTLKQFLKSKTFKCILVLVCIALVSGALLSILHDVLYVSESEKVARTIKGIYGKSIDYEVVEVDYSTEIGEITSVYKLKDGNYLIKSIGKNGYKYGTITVWVVATFENNEYKGITSISVAEYDKQTLMSKFTSSIMNEYKENPDYVVSGATYSSKAMSNAINTAKNYITNNLIEEA